MQPSQGKWTWRYFIAIILIVFGFISFVLTLFPFLNSSLAIDVTLGSQVGDLVGGIIGPIFSLAGVFLLFETLVSQKDAFVHQQFETKLFELIKMHRENVREIANNRDSSGRAVFKEIMDDFGKIWEAANQVESPEDFDQRDIVNACFIMLYFGTAEEEQELVWHQSLQTGAGITLFTVDILSEVNEPTKLSTGYQDILGHYFRHLYQTVTFVDSADFLTAKEKYNYVKTLRAQLSTHEQAILFFNVLSELGEDWELNPENDNKLVSDYNLIKNIPKGFTFTIDAKAHFPKVKFEYEEVA